MAEELPRFIPRILRADDVSLLRAEKAVFDGMRRRHMIICSSMSFPRGASSTFVSGPNVTPNLPLRSSVVVPKDV
jgi:hypothetical protein